MSLTLIGQKKTVIFDHYGITEKLMAGQALSIEKSKSGFLWVGTEQGLYKYDGHTFKVFKSIPYDSTTLSSNYISRIKEDKHGRIWTYADPEINIFDPVTEKCTRLKIPPHLSKSNALELRAMYYDEAKDVMWFGTNEGLLFTQGKDVHLKKFIVPGMDSRELVHFMHIDHNGIYWIATDYALHRFDEDICEASIYQRKADNKDDIVLGFFSGSFDQKNQCIWLGTWVHGLFRFDIKTRTIRSYKYRKDLGQNGVLTISPSGVKKYDNYLWVGTVDGLYAFDKRNEVFYDYRSDNYKDINGVSGAVFCLEPTINEGMWIGSFKGLHKFDAFKQNLERIDVEIPQLSSDWSPSVFAIESDSRKDSIIWLTVDYRSVFKYDLVRKIILPIENALKPYTDEVQPNSLFIDSRNVLWISSYKHSLNGYDLNNHKLIKPLGIDRPLTITTMVEDSQNNLWFGTSQGLFFYDRKGNVCKEVIAFKQFTRKHKVSNLSNSITIDQLGNIWGIIKANSGNDDGIFRFDPKTQIVNGYFQKDYLALKKKNVLNSIESISNNKLLITSFNGVCIVNSEKKDIFFEELNPQHHSEISGFGNIITDKSGNSWLSTDVGIARYDDKNQSMFQWTYYNSNMDQSIQPSLFYSKKSNVLYMSQKEGFNIVALDNIRLPKSSQLILSDLKIDHKKDRVLPKSGSVLNLPISQNSMTFSFSNLSFTNSDENKYQFSLGNESSPWKDMNSNILEFNNLGFGDYLLRVRAENAFGDKSPNMYVLNLSIAPPFWRTTWFNLMLIGLISSIIYSIFKYRENQRVKLEKLRYNIARDLHDDMGSNLSQIKMLSEIQAMKSQNPAFGTISNKLSDVMQNMIEIVWSINPKYDDINHVVQRIQEFAIQTLEPKEIHLRFDIDNIEISGMDPLHRRHLFLIFKEAINNIQKYAKASNVHLSVKSVAKSVHFSISDDGIGFDPKVINLGNGLKNMQQRAKELGGDLVFETGSKGTTIKLSLNNKIKF